MKMKTIGLAVFWLAVLFPATGFAEDALEGAPPKHSSWSFDAAREIPLQGGGRVKPLDSFAREVILFETGSRGFQGWDPIDLMFSQISAPDAWDDYPFLQVSREDVRRQLGLDEKRTRFTPKELRSNAVLGQYAMTASSAGRAGLRAHR